MNNNQNNINNLFPTNYEHFDYVNIVGNNNHRPTLNNVKTSNTITNQERPITNVINNLSRERRYTKMLYPTPNYPHKHSKTVLQKRYDTIKQIKNPIQRLKAENAELPHGEPNIRKYVKGVPNKRRTRRNKKYRIN